MNSLLAVLIFLLGLFCRLVYLVTGLALVGIGLVTLWWMSRDYLGLQTIGVYIGDETFQVHVQPGPMLPMPWHFETWFDWFWGIYRFGFLLQFALYATIASMLLGGLSFLMRIPEIPYMVAEGEEFGWVDGDDSELTGLKLAFGPGIMVIGVMAGTVLINIVMLTVAQLWIGDIPSGDDWAMAVTIQRTLPYLGWIGLILFLWLYTFFYGCLSWLAAIGVVIVIALRIFGSTLSWFGVTDPDTVFAVCALPPYLVVFLAGIAAMFVGLGNSRTTAV